MSRLQSHKQKQFVRNILVYTILFFILLYILFTFGFKFLINTSLFISRLSQSNSSSVSNLEKTEPFFGNLDVDSIPTATNSAKIMISGSVLNFDSLDFYINNEKVSSFSLSNSDSFVQEIGGLKSGDNEVYIMAKSKKNKNEKKSPVYKIIYKNDKPKLDISTPNDKQKTSSPDLKISGITDAEVFIKVNNMPAVVDSQGNFQYSLKLQNGENKIEISAQDIAGNTETRMLTVTYEKDE